MEWRYSEIMSFYYQFCSRESQKSKNSERWTLNMKQPCCNLSWWWYKSLSEVSTFLKAEDVYCTSPTEMMMDQTESQERVITCQRVPLTIITFHPTLKSSVFLVQAFFPSLPFLTANFVGNTFLGGKETKLFGTKASYGRLSTDENCCGHRFVLQYLTSPS